MTDATPIARVIRAGFEECLHLGHAVVARPDGVVAALGNPGLTVLPRSACKMIQALPLVESGAADAFGLEDEQLALACASHLGQEIHVSMIRRWLGDIGLGESDLRCGAHWPGDKDAERALAARGMTPDQTHNNCSGKHAGFLTFNRHIGGGTEYIDADHPVQTAVREAFEETTGEVSPGHAIDGCSAPNFATSLSGLARAMARFATPTEDTARGRAMIRLRQAMSNHPEYVRGEGGACTDLMRAMDGAAAKTGAEGVYCAILPGQGLGIAVKAVDGAGRAAEAAIASLLVAVGALSPEAPVARRLTRGEITNHRGIVCGRIEAVPPAF